MEQNLYYFLIERNGTQSTVCIKFLLFDFPASFTGGKYEYRSSPVGSNEPGLHLKVSEVVGILVRKSCDVSYGFSTNELTFLRPPIGFFFILSAENSRTILVHIIRVFIDQLPHHTTEKPTSKRE